MARVASILELLNKFSFMFVLAGFAPFVKRADAAGARITAEWPGRRTAVRFAVTYALVVACYTTRMLLTVPDDVPVFQAFYIQTFLLIVTSVLSYVYVVLRPEPYVRLQYAIRASEGLLHQLAVPTDYDGLCVAYAAFSCFIPIEFAVIFGSPEKQTFHKLLDMGNYGVTVMLRYITLSHQTVTAAVLLRQLEGLNAALERYSREPQDARRGRTDALEFLGRAAGAYQSIAHSCGLFLQAFSPLTLLGMLVNYVQFIFAIYLLFYQQISGQASLEMYVALVTFTSQMVAIYLYCHLTENKAKETMITLCTLNVTFCDSQAALKRNTFLLLGSNHRIQFSLCGILPLNLSLLRNQVSMCYGFAIYMITQNKN